MPRESPGLSTVKDPGTAHRISELRRQSQEFKETKVDTEDLKELRTTQRDNSRKLSSMISPCMWGTTRAQKECPNKIVGKNT